jgi:hypothetical protein
MGSEARAMHAVRRKLSNTAPMSSPPPTPCIRVEVIAKDNRAWVLRGKSEGRSRNNKYGTQTTSQRFSFLFVLLVYRVALPPFPKRRPAASFCAGAPRLAIDSYTYVVTVWRRLGITSQRVDMRDASSRDAHGGPTATCGVDRVEKGYRVCTARNTADAYRQFFGKHSRAKELRSNRTSFAFRLAFLSGRALIRATLRRFGASSPKRTWSGAAACQNLRARGTSSIAARK